MSFIKKVKLLGRSVVLVCIGIGLAGCGTVKTMPDLSLYGEANPELERNHIKAYKKNKAIDVNEVKVLVDTVPEGISVNDGQISSESDYEHEVIGHFSFRPDYKRQDSDALDAFTNYKTGWRKAVCYPQVPLRYVTLGLWKIIPTSYPCYGSISQSKEDMISEAQKLTKITGVFLILRIAKIRP